MRSMVESDAGRKTSFVKMTGGFYFPSFLFSLLQLQLIVIASYSGLNVQIVDFSDRSTECYVFNKSLMLDCHGKIMRPTRCPVVSHKTIMP